MDFVNIFPEEVTELIFRVLSEKEPLFKYLSICKSWNEFITSHSKLLIVDTATFNNLFPNECDFRRFEWKLEYILFLWISKLKGNVIIRGIQISTEHIDSMFSRFFQFLKLLAEVQSIEIILAFENRKGFINTFDKIFCLAPKTNRLKLVNPENVGRFSDTRIGLNDVLFERGELPNGQPIIQATRLIEHLDIVNGIWFSKALPFMFTNLRTLSLSGFFPFSIALGIIEVNPGIEELKFHFIGIKLRTILKCSLLNKNVVKVFKQLKTFSYINIAEATNGLKLPLNLNEDPIFPNVERVELFGFTINLCELRTLFHGRVVKQLGFEFFNFKTFKFFPNIDSLYLKLGKIGKAYDLARGLMESKTLKYLILDDFTLTTLLRLTLFIQRAQIMKIARKGKGNLNQLQEMLREGLIDDII